MVICPLIILDLKPLAEKDGGTKFDEFYQELHMFTKCHKGTSSDLHNLTQLGLFHHFINEKLQPTFSYIDQADRRNPVFYDLRGNCVGVFIIFVPKVRCR